MIACKKRDLDSVRTLLEHGADINAHVDTYQNTPLLQAAERGHCEIAEYLLDQGADVANALKVASGKGHDSIVKLLLDNGAEIDEGNCLRYTPLMAAAGAGHASTVRLLLLRGANVNKENIWGQTALYIAEDFGCGDTVSILKEWIQNKQNKQEILK